MVDCEQPFPAGVLTKEEISKILDAHEKELSPAEIEFWDQMELEYGSRINAEPRIFHPTVVMLISDEPCDQLANNTLSHIYKVQENPEDAVDTSLRPTIPQGGVNYWDADESLDNDPRVFQESLMQAFYREIIEELGIMPNKVRINFGLTQEIQKAFRFSGDTIRLRDDKRERLIRKRNRPNLEKAVYIPVVAHASAKPKPQISGTTKEAEVLHLDEPVDSIMKHLEYELVEKNNLVRRLLGIIKNSRRLEGLKEVA